MRAVMMTTVVWKEYIQILVLRAQTFLVGGFKPLENFSSISIISPGRGKNEKIFETTT